MNGLKHLCILMFALKSTSTMPEKKDTIVVFIYKIAQFNRRALEDNLDKPDREEDLFENTDVISGSDNHEAETQQNPKAEEDFYDFSHDVVVQSTGGQNRKVSVSNKQTSDKTHSYYDYLEDNYMDQPIKDKRNLKENLHKGDNSIENPENEFYSFETDYNSRHQANAALTDIKAQRIRGDFTGEIVEATTVPPLPQQATRSTMTVYWDVKVKPPEKMDHPAVQWCGQHAECRDPFIHDKIDIDPGTQ